MRAGGCPERANEAAKLANDLAQQRVVVQGLGLCKERLIQPACQPAAEGLSAGPQVPHPTDASERPLLVRQPTFTSNPG